jgi:hypothetical protein
MDFERGSKYGLNDAQMQGIGDAMNDVQNTILDLPKWAGFAIRPATGVPDQPMLLDKPGKRTGATDPVP